MKKSANQHGTVTGLERFKAEHHEGGQGCSAVPKVCAADSGRPDPIGSVVAPVRSVRRPRRNARSGGSN
jgi:hypothetical protein